MFDSMFSLPLPVLEKLLRPVAVYLFLVVLLRVFGKRELSQLNPFDLVVLLCLSNTVQNAIIGPDNSLTGGLTGAFALAGVNYLVVRFLLRHRRLDEVLAGRPTLLIENGRLMPAALAKEMMSRAELLTVLHRQGISSVSDVEKCTLQPGGAFDMVAIAPSASERRHQELLARLDHLQRQLDELKNAPPATA